MKKLVSVVVALAAATALPAQAAEVLAVFDNQGNCNSAWNDLLNSTRKDLRKSGAGVSQKDLSGMGLYYCAPSGNLWLLMKA